MMKTIIICDSCGSNDTSTDGYGQIGIGSYVADICTSCRKNTVQSVINILRGKQTETAAIHRKVSSPNAERRQRKRKSKDNPT